MVRKYVFLIAGLFLSSSFFFQCAPKQGQGLEIKVIGKASKDDIRFFQDFYSKMKLAIQNEDIEGSLSFYSEEFMANKPGQKEKLRSNIQSLYVNYIDISYLPTGISLSVENESAVTSDRYTYTAKPEPKSVYPKLDYQGNERIYWKKENGSWRIIEWIYY